MASTTSSFPDPAAVMDKIQAAAQAQSEADKAKNFHDAAVEIGKKMAEHPEAVTKEDASHLKSTEAKYTGVPQPPTSSISAAADRLVAGNEKGHAEEGGKGVQKDGIAKQ